MRHTGQVVKLQSLRVSQAGQQRRGVEVDGRKDQGTSGGCGSNGGERMQTDEEGEWTMGGRIRE